MTISHQGPWVGKIRSSHMLFIHVLTENKSGKSHAVDACALSIQFTRARIEVYL